MPSVIVLGDGKTVAEWYFIGREEIRGVRRGHVAFDAETLHDCRSVTKSIVATLFGIASGERAIASFDERVLNYFLGYADLRTRERMKVRLRDLLSMKSDIAWDEDTHRALSTLTCP